MTNKRVYLSNKLGYIDNTGLNLKPLSSEFAPLMVDLYGGVTARDLSSNGLDPDLAEAYSEEDKAEIRLEDLNRSMRASRPIGAYAVLDREVTTLGVGEGTIQGVAALAREVTATTRIQRILDRKETGKRIFTSWLKSDAPDHINPDTVMKAGLKLASLGGLDAVQIAVVQNLEHPTDGLTVVEHSIDPAEHGFVEVGYRTVTIEGKDYDSALFEHNIA